MCYNHIQYDDDSRTSATVTARCRQHSSITDLTYNWNAEDFSSSDSYQVDSSFSEPLTLVVKANDGSTDYTITLEPVSFVWQAGAIEQDPVYENGQKGGIVELFGWPHNDVKEECAYLA